jgi:hypothetical protein
VACRAVIWQHGVMTDLNTLVSGQSPVSLYLATDINERGEIAGQSVNQATQTAPPFLATTARHAAATPAAPARAARPRQAAVLTDRPYGFALQAWRISTRAWSQGRRNRRACAVIRSRPGDDSRNFR